MQFLLGKKPYRIRCDKCRKSIGGPGELGAHMLYGKWWCPKHFHPLFEKYQVKRSSYQQCGTIVLD